MIYHPPIWKILQFAHWYHLPKHVQGRNKCIMNKETPRRAFNGPEWIVSLGGRSSKITLACQCYMVPLSYFQSTSPPFSLVRSSQEITAPSCEHWHLPTITIFKMTRTQDETCQRHLHFGVLFECQMSFLWVPSDILWCILYLMHSEGTYWCCPLSHWKIWFYSFLNSFIFYSYFAEKLVPFEGLLLQIPLGRVYFFILIGIAQFFNPLPVDLGLHYHFPRRLVWHGKVI